MLRSLVALMAAAGGPPPTELRIFAKGKNASTKGEFIFDDKAAKAVMAAAAERGVEFPFDYNHGSTDPLGMLNPELSGKAAGWCKLALRDGELWATEIRWTENALKAIAAAEWRYISPTFATDKDKRVTALWAIALTNTPGLHNLEPLVAASLVSAAGASMDWCPMCFGRFCSVTSICCQACPCKVQCCAVCCCMCPPDMSPSTQMSAAQFRAATKPVGDTLVALANVKS